MSYFPPVLNTFIHGVDIMLNLVPESCAFVSKLFNSDKEVLCFVSTQNDTFFFFAGCGCCCCFVYRTDSAFPGHCGQIVRLVCSTSPPSAEGLPPVRTTRIKPTALGFSRHRRSGRTFRQANRTGILTTLKVGPDFSLSLPHWDSHDIEGRAGLFVKPTALGFSRH